MPDDKGPCYWCGSKDHTPQECPAAPMEKMKKCYQAVTDELIQGDYIGTMRGEVNICLNVIHYLRAFEEATRLEVGETRFREIMDRAYQIRRLKYGMLLW